MAWHTFIRSHSKKHLHSYIPHFEPSFLVKKGITKIKFRPCNLTLIYSIKKKLCTISKNTYIQYQKTVIYNIMYFFSFYTIKTKKEQAINLYQKNLHLKNFKNQKGTSNKSVPENYFFIFVIHRHAVKYIITLCIPKLL